MNLEEKKKHTKDEASSVWCRNHKGTAYNFDEYMEMIKRFHGYPAPGLIIAGKMVDTALGMLPEGILFDAICETDHCLPDAVQLLTPCTIGNGWMKIINFKIYAVTLYDKMSGEGYRVGIDGKKLDEWEEIKCWFFKLKEKKDQNTELLFEQIKAAGDKILSLTKTVVNPELLEKKHLGKRAFCPMCGEVYPADHGYICRPCQGKSPYVKTEPSSEIGFDEPKLKKVPVKESVGKTALHDMTEVIPGKFKGVAFKSGMKFSAGDVCRLQRMGKEHIYVLDDKGEVAEKKGEWVHENDAVLKFAEKMAGDGISYDANPREGKINFIANRDGLLMIDAQRLEIFNSISGVMCATRKGYSVISKDRKVGGTRAIGLFTPKDVIEKALAVLNDAPLFRVLPMKKANIGILVTGTEIFNGLVEDRFIPIIISKITKLGCRPVKSMITPDDRDAISKSVKELLDAGAEMIITTAGLSVDPDDVTRLGLKDAGAEKMIYGLPVLPGAMALLAKIGNVPVIGVPACALYYMTTSFDLLFPRLLAGLDITRKDLAKLGHGGLCWDCKVCRYPKCSFGQA